MARSLMGFATQAGIQVYINDYYVATHALQILFAGNEILYGGMWKHRSEPAAADVKGNNMQEKDVTPDFVDEVSFTNESTAEHPNTQGENPNATANTDVDTDQDAEDALPDMLKTQQKDEKSKKTKKARHARQPEADDETSPAKADGKKEPYTEKKTQVDTTSSNKKNESGIFDHGFKRKMLEMQSSLDQTLKLLAEKT
eukprot:TRINITY_DN38889_c0_g1_i1.p2 TRINITY_DN38889_c0_g1~~TRINITY_DN38889_c0_g1_i1.p2  ORF type:complete len:206 (+),score=53.61 TRINITY_DN38889_c0_g1_i1:23-619(+)